MSELRYDPLSGHWVNVAAIRAERPNEFRREEFRRPDAICPFCAGQEFQTPPAILELTANGDSASANRANAAHKWLVRVVPNKYPAFAPATEARERQAVGPYARLSGDGSHEIIVESPRHVSSLSQLSDAELEWSFRAYQIRILAAQALLGIRQLVLFKNCRAEAGASIEHVHSQLIASPVLTDPLAARWERCKKAQRDSGISLLESIVRFEEQDPGRVIESRGRFVAFCPYASRFAFQVWIAQRSELASFEQLTEDDLRDVAQLTRSAVGRLERTLDTPPYNLVLHLPPESPATSAAQEIFPWFIEIIPRLGRWAGFELADGGWILDWPPEIAAAKLRGK